MAYCQFECTDTDGVVVIDMAVRSTVEQGQACDLIRQRAGIRSARIRFVDSSDSGAPDLLARCQGHIETPAILAEAFFSWLRDQQDVFLTLDLSKLDSPKNEPVVAYWSSWQDLPKPFSVTVTLPSPAAAP